MKIITILSARTTKRFWREIGEDATADDDASDKHMPLMTIMIVMMMVMTIVVVMVMMMMVMMVVMVIMIW